MEVTKKHLPQLNIIRGLASLLVCFFHLSVGNSNFWGSSNFITQVGQYGYLGLYMFFILSGFVITWAMPENYSYQNAKIYFFKRFTRIEPVYIASILLVLFVDYLSSSFRGLDYTVSPLNLVLHLGYLNNFINIPYINIVYWTLGIEFQFYILIGVFYGFIKKSNSLLILFILIFNALSFIKISNDNIIFQFSPLFSLGIITAFYLNKKICSFKYIILFVSCLICVYLNFELPVFWVSILTIVVILVGSNSNWFFDFLAKISFSLYLIHVPLGGKIINLGTRYADTFLSKLGVLLFALLFCIICSYYFYIIIEKRFLKASKEWKYYN